MPTTATSWRTGASSWTAPPPISPRTRTSRSSISGFRRASKGASRTSSITAAGSGGSHEERQEMRNAVALLALATGCTGAFAQGYPSKPIHLVVGFAPGGAADIIARTMSDPLARALGQGIIVDNRPGAGSSIAAEFVAKASPDGYTVMIASQSGMIINPLINKSVGYNTARDFAAITQVTSSPLVVAVNPALGVTSIAELIAAAKKAPGKLNFATSGNGSLPHLAATPFTAIAGVQMVHV